MKLETVIAKKSVIFSNNISKIKSKQKITTQRERRKSAHSGEEQINHATGEEQKITLQAEEPSRKDNIQEN